MRKAVDRHRADIQGLRGLAVVLVVLFHTGLSVPGGFVGVDVFFVISGFVITRLLWGELRSTGRLDLPAFYARRVRRLLPALAILLTTVAFGALVFESPLGSQRDTANTGVAAALFAANAQLVGAGSGYFGTSTQANPLLHTWTLAVEEQFYLAFPMVLLVAARFGRPSRADGSAGPSHLIAIGAVFVGSLLLSAFLTSAEHAPLATLAADRAFAFYSSLTRAWEFALGSLLALSEPRIARFGPAAATACGVCGLALVAGGSLAFTAATPFPGIAALVPAIGAGLLVMAGTLSPLGVAALLSLRPLTWIGDLSYGWYLWHWPFIVYARSIWPEAAGPLLLAAAVLALVPTWLSYRFVEQPVRADRTVAGLRAVMLAVRCCFAPVVLFAALWTLTAFPVASVRDISSQIRPHEDESRNCRQNLPNDPRTGDLCTWHTAGARGAVVLIGDSNAGQFVEPVAAAANRWGLDLTVAVFPGCPFADVTIHYAFIDEAACRSFVTAWTEEFERSRPALVILANASSDYLADPASDQASQLSDVSFESVTSHERASTAADKVRLWGEGIASTLRALAARQVPTILVHTIPHLPSFDLRTCPAFRIYLDQSSCAVVVSRARIVSFGQPAIVVERRAIADAGLATGVDLSDDICTPVACSSYRDGRWVYRDGGHLSVAAATGLTPRFTELIASFARAASAD